MWTRFYICFQLDKRVLIFSELESIREQSYDDLLQSVLVAPDQSVLHIVKIGHHTNSLGTLDLDLVNRLLEN